MESELNCATNTRTSWETANKWETDWWGDCTNTSDEEAKQHFYAEKMGIPTWNANLVGKVYELNGKSVLDIGGGPISLLLKCRNRGRSVIVDPGNYPDWIIQRYNAAKIEYIKACLEDTEFDYTFDEVWIYNVLQHVKQPDTIIQKALKWGKVIRVFEWIETEVNIGHPHCLTQDYLEKSFNCKGTIIKSPWGSATAEKAWSGIVNNEAITAFELVKPIRTKLELKTIEHNVVQILNAQPKSDITVTITSCGRFDLLEKTINSLMATIGRPVKVLIYEDSVEEDKWIELCSQYGNRFNLYKSTTKKGQAWALDFLYSKVDTPYLFHCEDDWEFIKPGYTEASLEVLNENPDIIIVGISLNDALRQTATGKLFTTKSGIRFYEHPRWRLSDKHDWWNGWIGSPNLKRTADTRRLAHFSTVTEESQYDSLVFKPSGFKSVWLEETYVKHIGDNRSLYPNGDMTPRTWLVSKPAKVIKEQPMEQPKTTYRFHLLGLAHLPTSEQYLSCAYTQKIVKLATMLKSLGHTVFFYGNQDSKVECDRYFTVLTNKERIAVYGDYDWKKEFFKHDPNDDAHRKFNARCIAEIKAHKQDYDFLLCPMGNYDKPIADALNLKFVVESGIGYSGIFAPFKVWESYGWMNHIYGMQAGLSVAIKPSMDAWKKAVAEGRTQKGFRDWSLIEINTDFDGTNGSWYDIVIPNYWNPADFHLGKKGDYYLYIGRLISRKGVTTACEATAKLGVKLIIAGQGDLKNVDGHDLTKFKHIEYVGTVDKEQRADLMAGALATFVPTWYMSPFEGVHVESMLSGTPCITTDWGCFPETNIQGVTGYRCRTMNEFVWAAREAPKLNAETIRDYAIRNYSMDVIAQKYQAYFDQLYDVTKAGWYQDHEGWNPGRYQHYYPAQ